VIADLRPPMLDDYGLLPTLRWCGQQLGSRTDVEVVVRGEEPAPRLPSSTEDTLVRITQEALTNVAKHAQAGRVTISLAALDDAVRLAIEDDGMGFDKEMIAQRESDHWGLLTMTERAESVGGHCRILSKPGEGTAIIVEVPT
jgi:signal transduction histidine kinase